MESENESICVLLIKTTASNPQTGLMHTFEAPALHGLYNHGATCYLNSILQVLFMTEDFKEALNSSKTTHIDHLLKDLFDRMKTQPSETIQIVQALGIDRVCEQHDAAEYCQKILSMTSYEAAKIFYGELSDRTACDTCGQQTERDEPFWVLPLSLVQCCNENYSVKGGIDEFFRISHFSKENLMYCESCDKKVEATAQYVVQRHPDVLILLLKRFDFSYQYMSYVKINSAVAIPSFLTIPENQTYQLYAVIDHFGNLASGHYTSTIKCPHDDNWYTFDDTSVRRVQSFTSPQNDNILNSNSAFLLFYRKKGSQEMDEEMDTSHYPNEEDETNQPERQELGNTVLNDKTLKMAQGKPKRRRRNKRKKKSRNKKLKRRIWRKR